MIVLRTLLIIPSAMAFFESLPCAFSFLAMASWMPVSMIVNSRRYKAISVAA